MNWRQERKQERRRRKGLRVNGFRVVPPSLGKRHMEINPDVRFRFEEFMSFIEEHEGRIRVSRRNISYWDEFNRPAREHLEKNYANGGIRALTLLRFPESYFVEIDDDDTFEVLFTLRFG